MMVYGAEVKIPNDVAEWYEKHFGVEEDNLIDYNEDDGLDEVDGFYDDESNTEDSENSQEWALQIMEQYE